MLRPRFDCYTIDELSSMCRKGYSIEIDPAQITQIENFRMYSSPFERNYITPQFVHQLKLYEARRRNPEAYNKLIQKPADSTSLLTGIAIGLTFFALITNVIPRQETSANNQPDHK